MNFAEALLNSSAPGDKVALFTQQAEVTYDQLREQAVLVAAYLRQRGLEPGDRVLLLGESSPFWVQSYLGIALAGGVSVPLSVPASPEFFTGVVQATEPRFAFVQAKWLRRLDMSQTGCELIISDSRPPRLDLEMELATTAEMKMVSQEVCNSFL